VREVTGRPKVTFSVLQLPQRSRLQISAIRWASVVALAVVGAVLFEVLVPVAWTYALRTDADYSPVFLGTVVWLVSLIGFYIVCEPIRIRRRQWRNLALYPPCWFAVVLAWLLAAASERLPDGIRPRSYSTPDWQHAFPVAWVALAILIAISLRQLPWFRRVQKEIRLENSETVTWSEIADWIAAGERPVDSTEFDLFRHRAIASRIAQTIARSGGPVALLGRFGTGKSSILNLLRAELDQSSTPLVHTSLDVWAAPEPEDVPRLALDRIVTALDEVVETIAFRTLPTSYQRLAAAEPSGRLNSALGIGASTDSLDELKRLSPILQVLDIRIVLIIEDIERAGHQFDYRHLERFLWALRGVERASFILAVDPTSTSVDCEKLCDIIERVPALDFKQVARVFTVAFSHWRSAYSYIDPHPDRNKGDKLRLDEALMEGLMDYVQRTGQDTPIHALLSLLGTPRALKHVLRRVDRAWQYLHGEAELDDIVIVAALRHAAEPVYHFLLANIDAARHKPDRVLSRTQTVKADWDKLLDELPCREASQRLVNLLGIDQLSKEQTTAAMSSLQGVHLSDPVDYFSRIVAEQVGPDEIRDQSVLQDIASWQASRGGPLITQLVAASAQDVQYPRVWEHFAKRHSHDEWLELTSVVVEKILARDQSAASDDHPAISALWRMCQGLEKNTHTEWLRALILTAVPTSLQLVNGLYHYWTGRHGIVDDAQRRSIRDSISEAVRSTIRTAHGLVKVIPPDGPYEVKKFITQTGTQPTSAAFAEWRSHFAPLIVDGAAEYPETMIPILATLGGDEQSSMTTDRIGPPVFVNLYTFDRQAFTLLLEDRLDEGLAFIAGYSGSNVYATRAIGPARTWLLERAGTGTKRTDRNTDRNP
jgi:hypothetical protein